jgi:cellulose synthase/poly-beta-1,6-N-acetylglucosamine synthase-like glycosyltransferase
MFIHTVFLCISITLTLFFFLYGLNHYYLLNAARRYKIPGLPMGPAAQGPRVAIHLPVYNEKYVIHRLVSACTQMAEVYGIDRVRIVILDDSDDDTVHTIDQEVTYHRWMGFQVEVLRRDNRQGFKAGALQAALDRTEEEFIAVFDADFIPTPEFLVGSMPYFLQDDRLGIIQTRWTHTNRTYNVLTEAIAVGIDVHFLIEQAGRYAAGCLQNFNGSGGILRAKALRQAGGWQADTLAEDLDASYRIQMQGYHLLYLRDLHSPGEVPPTIPSYKKQQGRWACGSLQTAKKLLPDLLSNRRYGIKLRLEAFIHLTGYLVHPLMFSSFLLACLSTLLRVDVFRLGLVVANLRNTVAAGMMNPAASMSPRYLMWSLAGLLIILCTIAAWIPPLVALKTQPRPWWRKISSFFILFFLGCGVSLSNTIEAGKALFTRRSWAFRRTPKYAIQYGKDKWRDKRYQVSLDFVWLVELVFVGLGLSSIGYSISNSNYGVLLILVPFTAAYTFVLSLTILQSRQEV